MTGAGTARQDRGDPPEWRQHASVSARQETRGGRAGGWSARRGHFGEAGGGAWNYAMKREIMGGVRSRDGGIGR